MFNHRWFSDPQPTIEQAQELHGPDGWFDPAAVFSTPNGYVMGLLSVNTNYPPHEAAENVKELLGYEMVSYCDALFGIWKPYEAKESEAK